MPAVVSRRRRGTNICTIPRCNEHSKRIAPSSVEIKRYRSRIYYTGFSLCLPILCIAHFWQQYRHNTSPGRPFSLQSGSDRETKIPHATRTEPACTIATFLKIHSPEPEHVHPRRARKKKGPGLPLILFTNFCLQSPTTYTYLIYAPLFHRVTSLSPSLWFFICTPEHVR